MNSSVSALSSSKRQRKYQRKSAVTATPAAGAVAKVTEGASAVALTKKPLDCATPSRYTADTVPTFSGAIAAPPIATANANVLVVPSPAPSACVHAGESMGGSK